MKTNIYKKIPKKILEYLIVFCMMLCTCTMNAQCIPNGATCICPMIYMPVCGCDGRSEEHTSELQSRRNPVCRPPLEKKKHIA